MLGLEKIREYVKDKFHGKEYSTGDYYTKHICKVADELKAMRDIVEKIYSIKISSEKFDLMMKVAYLHDILEDTNTVYDELVDLFGDEVAKRVKVLTRKDGEDYSEYIGRVVDSDDVTRFVKECDLQVNIDAGHNAKSGYEKQRLEKYKISILFLRTIRHIRMTQNVEW